MPATVKTSQNGHDGNMTIKLTIAIPTLNRCQLLKRAIDSALAQTAGAIEIIVSNNGSTDRTKDLLSGYADQRLRVFHRDETIDACSHGNFLLAKTRGELFLGLSDDDYIAPDFAASIIDFFTTHPELSFAYTGCNIHYANVVVPAKTGPAIESGHEFLRAFLDGKRDVCWCACVTRSADLRTIGDIPQGTICGDMFYWTKLAARGPVGCIDSPLSHYVAFSDEVSNHSCGTPVAAWAAEVETLADYISSICISETPEAADELRRIAASFVARSTADQFVWNALRGTRRNALLAALPKVCRQLAGGSPEKWLRIGAAIGVPRRLLRQRVLAAAARKALSIQDARAKESA